MAWNLRCFYRLGSGRGEIVRVNLILWTVTGGSWHVEYVLFREDTLIKGCIHHAPCTMHNT